MVSYKLSGRVAGAGFQVDYDPPKDRECFYAAAAHQLGISCAAAKKRVFEHLQSNRIDVSVYILNCQTFFSTKTRFQFLFVRSFFHFETLQYIPNKHCICSLSSKISKYKK